MSGPVSKLLHRHFPTQQFYLLQHCLRCLLLFVGRVTVLAQDSLDNDA